MDINKLQGHIDYNHFEITACADKARHAASITLEDMERAVGSASTFENIADDYIKSGKKWRLQGNTGSAEIEIIFVAKPLRSPGGILGFIGNFFNLFHSGLFFQETGSIRFRHGMYHGRPKTHHIRILEIKKLEDVR